jgi:hypothetical protein
MAMAISSQLKQKANCLSRRTCQDQDIVRELVTKIALPRPQDKRKAFKTSPASEAYSPVIVPSQGIAGDGRPNWIFLY